MTNSKQTLQSKLTNEYNLESLVYALGQDVTFFGTEIEVLRLAQKFNGTKESKVFYSENLSTWCVSFPYWFTPEAAQRITEATEEAPKKDVVVYEEMGQEVPTNIDIEYSIAYGGKFYCKSLKTFKGRGIKKEGDASENPRKMHTYLITENAFNKLKLTNNICYMASL